MVMINGTWRWGVPGDEQWDWSPTLRHAALFECYDDAVDAIDGMGDPLACIAEVVLVVRGPAPVGEGRGGSNVH